VPDGYRRPSEKWCTDTAVRLVKIGSRESLRNPRLIEVEDARVLLKAAAILDVFGQAAAIERETTRA
jgi:hypothetical protein